MNYELRNIDYSFISSIVEARRIKLRKLSYENVFNAWNTLKESINTNDINTSDIDANNFDKDDTEDMTNFIPNDKVFETSIKRMNVNIDNLNNEIMMLDTEYGYVDLIKRRVLAISKDMYDGIVLNTSETLKGNVSDVNTNIDEEEIRKAVKDAFDQIEFDKPIEEDIVITPEEVSSTVVSYDDQNDEEDETSVDIPNGIENDEFDSGSYPINSFDSDSQDDIDDTADNTTSSENNFEFDEYDDKQPLFNFEDINFDKIDIDENQPLNEDNSVEENIEDDIELDDILSQVKELKARKDEQDKKTEAAKNLAKEKEEEKEKIKEDFIAYKHDIEEELNRSKQLENENLERARKAEKFSEALSNIMG